MANRKKTDETEIERAVEAEAEKTAEKKTVTVILPRDPNKKGEEADQEFFSVNFKNYLIKTEEPVEVPVEIVEVINNIAQARREARAYAKKVAFREAKPPA